ncbi:MAG TPA: tetratricopeptide repeat protein [Phycisphaerae bacterium]|nr:tetratricopeptide repeat protein [Phycisphaerae bacterium]
MSALLLVTMATLLASGQSPADAPAKNVLGQSAAAADSAREILDMALRDYEQAVAAEKQSAAEARTLYQKALQGFDTLASRGHLNGHLYYNIANTYLRLGDRGRAILNYRRASKLIPSDRDVRHNLAHARSLVSLQLESSPSSALMRNLLFWHFDTSLRFRTALAISLFVAFWIVLGVKLFIRRRLPALTSLAIIGGLAGLAAGASVTWDMTAARRPGEGVLVGDQVILRKGSGVAYEPQVDRPLPAGLEVKILETRAGASGDLWRRVKLSERIDGWVPASQIETL